MADPAGHDLSHYQARRRIHRHTDRCRSTSANSLYVLLDRKPEVGRPRLCGASSRGTTGCEGSMSRFCRLRIRTSSKATTRFKPYGNSEQGSDSTHLARRCETTDERGDFCGFSQRHGFEEKSATGARRHSRSPQGTRSAGKASTARSHACDLLHLKPRKDQRPCGA